MYLLNEIDSFKENGIIKIKGFLNQSEVNEVIKKIIETNIFDDNEYIGIFSPRFFEKTGLTGSDVIEIVGKSKSEIINFSPN